MYNYLFFPIIFIFFQKIWLKGSAPKMSKDLYLHLNIYIYKNYVFQEFVHKNCFTEESLCYLKYTYFVDQLLMA